MRATTPIKESDLRSHSSGIHINPANKGKYTERAGGHKNIGAQIKKDLAPGSHATGLEKKEANFARMARRHFKPL